MRMCCHDDSESSVTHASAFASWRKNTDDVVLPPTFLSRRRSRLCCMTLRLSSAGCVMLRLPIRAQPYEVDIVELLFCLETERV